MQKIIIGILIVILVGLGIYAYALRPTAMPSDASGEGAPTSESGVVDGAFDPAVYAVVAKKSFVQFTIGEVLRGEPFKAVGKTSAVSGTLAHVRVNARTFKTDSDSRDRAIARFVLESEKSENEFIEFRLGKIEGMPIELTPGAEVPVAVVGNLIIRGVSKPVVFKGALRVASASEIAVSAEATIKRADYNLQIPNVPFVASVEDAVILRAEIAFRAK